MGLKDISINLVLVGLFALALLTAGIQLAIDNNAEQSISDDPAIGNLRANISNKFDSYQTEINASQNSFSTTNPVVGTESTQLISVAGIWKTFVTLPFTVFKLTIGLIIDKVFGGVSSGFVIVFTVVITLVAAVIIMYAWQWIRGGFS